MALTLKEKVKTIFSLLFEPKVFSALVSLRAWGYLLDMGWFNSFKSRKPVDLNNDPLPWFTYPAIDYLSGRLNKKLTVFEFGSGNSTVYFASRVNNVVSVEHNLDWLKKMTAHKLDNVDLISVTGISPDDYITPLQSRNSKYDIIVIDGIYRNECLIESVNHLTDRGIIILDDAERYEYSESIRRILKNNFKRLDFWGISPGFLYRKATTIFYRQLNCLDI